MLEAIGEAKKSRHRPTVGAVVVKDGKIIRRGHRTVLYPADRSTGKVAIIHGEQAALAAAGPDVTGADLYVTLQPCYTPFNNNHRLYRGPLQPFPTCSNLVSRSGIARVIIGLVDIKDPGTRDLGIAFFVKSGIRVEAAYLGMEEELHALVGEGNFNW